MTPQEFREARELLGLQQKELAAAFGMDGPDTIQNWEQGRRVVPFPGVFRLAFRQLAEQLAERRGAMAMARQREIEVYTCCGRRGITITVETDEFAGEAWRLARCLVTTHPRRRDNGVIVESLLTNLELSEREGWDAERLAKTRRMYPDWETKYPHIDWKFGPFHIWPDHRNGPHNDPDPERLRLLAMAYLQREAERITEANSTVRAAGDYSVRLLREGNDESCVILPDEQREGDVAAMMRALFGD